MMGSKTWTIHKLLKVTADYLREKEIESPRLSAEILLAFLLNTTRINLYLQFDRPLKEEEITGYRSLIRRRLSREPIQYITGSQEFWSIEFIVGPQVLIPRPESELLVEQVIDLFKKEKIPEAGCPRILDLGTGCGALAVSLSMELKNASLWASDISGEALKVAQKNAERYGLKERIVFIQGDLLQTFRHYPPPFDIILSNPPYIESDVFGSLSPEVRDHEPRLALDGRAGGLFYIKEIAREGVKILKPGGWLLMEMDPGQTSRALGFIDESGQFCDKKRVKDYSHRYRVVMAQKGHGEDI